MTEKTTEKVMATRAPEPVGAYPHARKVGDFIFVSGMGPRQLGQKVIPGVDLDANGQVRSYNLEVQLRATIENVRAVLEEAGASLNDVVDVTCFLTNMKKDFAE